MLATKALRHEENFATEGTERILNFEFLVLS